MKNATLPRRMLVYVGLGLSALAGGLGAFANLSLWSDWLSAGGQFSGLFGQLDWTLSLYGTLMVQAAVLVSGLTLRLARWAATRPLSFVLIAVAIADGLASLLVGLSIYTADDRAGQIQFAALIIVIVLVAILPHGLILSRSRRATG